MEQSAKVTSSIESESIAKNCDEKLYIQTTSEIESQSQKQSRWKNFRDSFKRMEHGNSSSSSSLDLEDAQPKNNLQNNDLKKGLKKRQLQMIALGGCVGSGLLVASGMALRNGPGTLLVAWAIVSSFLYCTMQSLAELSSAFPLSGSFATYANRFIDPSWGFAMGWNYALFWVIVMPLELVASSITINFWQSSVNSVAWVAIFYVLIIVLNLCGNRGFGETEFVASVIKLLGIVGFNILAIILICGGGDQGFIGGKFYRNPGSFTTGFKGVVSVLITATYSLAGTELIGLTTSESEGNPRIMLPKAIKQVFWRIMIFYMLTLTLIGFLVPANSEDLIGGSGASASPFVIAIRQGGIKVLPSIFNVIVLVALLAIGNSAVYGFSRTVLALAEQGLAPKIFNYVDRQGRPLVGIMVCAIIGLLAFVSASPKEAEVFAWLVALSGLSTLFTWGSINASYLRFRAAYKYHGRDLQELPYISNTGIIGAWYGLIMNAIVLGLQLFWIGIWPIGAKPDAKAYFENNLAFVIVIAFYVGHKIYSRTLKFYRTVDEIDIDTGRTQEEIDLLLQEKAEEIEAAKLRPVYKRILNFWC
ncbi:Gap6 general amino acid permease [Scheffersomyces amazonensis]|uniref:Gap6 general amino acid permease n=1 Tax=Scheffersomyces amazonensis TaxID=1078765 RepID=UPI00315D1561